MNEDHQTHDEHDKIRQCGVLHIQICLKTGYAYQAEGNGEVFGLRQKEAEREEYKAVEKRTPNPEKGSEVFRMQAAVKSNKTWN